jgi:hypothetical protein
MEWNVYYWYGGLQGKEMIEEMDVDDVDDQEPLCRKRDEMPVG